MPSQVRNRARCPTLKWNIVQDPAKTTRMHLDKTNLITGKSGHPWSTTLILRMILKTWLIYNREIRIFNKRHCRLLCWRLSLIRLTSILQETTTNESSKSLETCLNIFELRSGKTFWQPTLIIKIMNCLRFLKNGKSNKMKARLEYHYQI